jgi:hypothetical protein
MKKIFIAQPDKLNSWEIGEPDRISLEIAKSEKAKIFEIVSDKKDADIIVLLESCTFKSQKDLNYFKDILDGWNQQQKIFVINYEDHPPGVIPGIYSSLESFNYDSEIHVSWPHMKFHNEYVSNYDEMNAQPDFLFSFSGSCSHPLRRVIFREFVNSTEDIHVEEINKWYNHSELEKTSYAENILNSFFVLCPRGLASYSHRIIETLAMGRVPVIIADDWVPFSVDEEDYYIRISERDAHRVDCILRNEINRYKHLRHNAQKVYSKYFCEEDRYLTAFNKIVELAEKLPNHIDKIFLTERLQSREFHRVNTWLLHQRVNRAIKWRWRRLKGMICGN